MKTTTVWCLVIAISVLAVTVSSKSNSNGVLPRVLEKRASDFCKTHKPGVHADPDNCFGYIMCDMAGNTFERPCPPGLMFNPDLLVCDWPENVDCKV